MFSINTSMILSSFPWSIGPILDGSGVAGAGDRKGHLLGFLHMAGMKRGLSPQWRIGLSPAPGTTSQKAHLASSRLTPGPSSEHEIQESRSKISLILPPRSQQPEPEQLGPPRPMDRPSLPVTRDSVTEIASIAVQPPRPEMRERADQDQTAPGQPPVWN